MNNIIIKEDLNRLLIPLTIEELNHLEQSILKDGCRDALIVWKDKNILVDGHNRYRICSKHNISFKTIEREFENENEVKYFMLTNQLARRNLNDYAKSLVALQLEDYFREKSRINKEKGIELARQHNPKVSKELDINTLDSNTQQNNFLIPQNSAKSEKINTNDNCIDRKEEKLFLKEHPTIISPIEKVDTRKELAKIAGVSHDTIMKVKKIEEKATDETKQKLIENKTSINKVYQEIRQEEKKEERKNSIKETSLLSDQPKKYRVIYADPPWSYNDKQDTEKLGGANKYYETMNIQSLCDLPVPTIIEDNAVLFLWVTSPLLEESFKVMKAWGFEYKTSFIWDKVKHNMGHYNSVRHEFLLICVKGSCTPDNKTLFDSVQTIERSDKHSEKPIEFMNIIDTLYTFGNRIELFAREKSKDNWDFWGNEI